jgi:hypothetical protein
MVLALCNLLGPLCTTYRFADGTVIRRSSRESITYEGSQKEVHIEFYSSPNGYEYHIPENVIGDERHDVIQKVKEYCEKKRYKNSKLR